MNMIALEPLKITDEYLRIVIGFISHSHIHPITTPAAEM